MVTSNKHAGITASFFVKNIVIDNTMSNLMFFYDSSARMSSLLSAIEETKKLEGMETRKANEAMAGILSSKLMKQMVAGVPLSRTNIRKPTKRGSSSSEIDENMNQRYFMLNEKEELFAAAPDSNSVSDSINIQNAGMKDKMTLYKGELEELEFMY
jgi:hypothetical protein